MSIITSKLGRIVRVVRTSDRSPSTGMKPVKVRLARSGIYQAKTGIYAWSCSTCGCVSMGHVNEGYARSELWRHRDTWCPRNVPQFIDNRAAFFGCQGHLFSSFWTYLGDPDS